MTTAVPSRQLKNKVSALTGTSEGCRKYQIMQTQSLSQHSSCHRSKYLHISQLNHSNHRCGQHENTMMVSCASIEFMALNKSQNLILLLMLEV
eukprot:c22414_g4_i1 orf=138-416(+)